MTVNKITTAPTSNEVTDKINEIIDNIPTVPPVNNATLTITQGGVSKGTFTANASSDVTIALDAGGSLSSLTDVSLSSPASGQVLEYNGSNWINANSYNRNIGEIVTSTIPLTDAGLHLLDGSLIDGDGIYSEFVDYIASLYSEETLYCWYFVIDGERIYTKTLNLTSNSTLYNSDGSVYNGVNYRIHYYSSEPHYRIYDTQNDSDISHQETGDIIIPSNPFTTEANWQTAVTTYGVCGKFVYDSVNNTVRLPKVTGFVEGASGTATLGDLTEAGLPNITGSFTGHRIGTSDNAVADGAFTVTSSENRVRSGQDSATPKAIAVSFDASDSNSIYGNSTTVQPQTIKVLYYIVIATSTKTDIQVDIDEIATDLNGKADTDLTNVSNTSGFRKLVEIYNNGASWYKVFSEYNPSTGDYIGQWCEQGGGGVTKDTTITFLKAFKDTNYNVLVTFNSTSNYNGNYGVNASYKTSTDFKILTNSASTPLFAWQACGYIS